MRSLRIVGALVVQAGLFLAACSSGGADASTTLPSDGGIAGDGAADASDAASPDGAPSSDASVDAGNASADPLAICNPSLVLGAGTRLPSSTLDDDVGLSVTLDGLTAAWITQAPALTLHYVDRASAAVPFGAEHTLIGGFGSGRVALRGNGLGIAVVTENGLGFALAERAARDDAFGEFGEGPFSVLNAAGTAELAPAGEQYADPLFANDDKYFVFSRYSPVSTTTVYVSSIIFPMDPYSGGTPFVESALAPVGTRRKIVTSASADVRTLFLRDEATSTSRFITLDAVGGVKGSGDLGPVSDVQSSADCRTFFFSAHTAGAASDLFRYSIP